MIDVNGDGKITYDEFLKWWRSEDKFGKLQLDDGQLLLFQRAATYFRYFDKDQNGVVDRQEFKDLHADLVKHNLTDKSYEACLADLDINNDGVIQFNEYIDWLIRIGSIPVKVIDD